MPAGKHGSSEITVSYDDAPGGTFVLSNPATLAKPKLK